MFRKIGDALRRFMAGRYGTDKLNQWLLGLAIVLIVLGLIGGRAGSAILAVLGTVAYVPLIWSLFRMYSRNIEARRRENAAFQRVLTQLKDRDHRYYRLSKVPPDRARAAWARENQYPLPEMQPSVHQKDLIAKFILLFPYAPVIICPHGVVSKWL